MNLNRENMKKICWLIVFTIGVFYLVNHVTVVGIALAYLVSLLSPFLVGGAIAFILNVPMKVIEERVIRLAQVRYFRFLNRCYRVISILFTLIFVVALVVLMFFMVLPELGRTAVSFAQDVQPVMEEWKIYAVKLVQDYPDLAEQIRRVDIDWQSIGQKAVSILSVGAGSIVKSTVNVATTVVNVVVNAVLAIIFAVYVLAEKEKLGKQAKKLLYAWTKKKVADRVLKIVRLSNHTFHNFITGQCLESVILGAMFFVCMSLFRLPYAMVISVVIGVSALIPVVGAFIGCALGIILIVIESPMQALIFTIMFLVLQQIEGNVIYPRVVGNSVGLPAIWVLVAITVGGSLMGVLGMVIFIPICSVAYSVLREEVNKQLEKRRINVDRV